MPPPGRQLAADAALLVVTLIWGSTFVMVKDAVASFPVFSFLAVRFTCAALAFLPVLWLRQRRAPPSTNTLTNTRIPCSLFVHSCRIRGWPPRPAAALLVGAALFAGYAFQTSGLALTTPAKAGFITGLSVVIVPLVAALVLRQPPGAGAWAGVALATGGLALLSLQGDLTVSTGDMLVLGCAFSFAAHILLTGRFAPYHDPLLLTFGQVLTVAVLTAAAALLWEGPRGLAGLPAGMNAQLLFAAAFTGVLATSVAFGVQTLAQRFTTASHTALIFAAEPVFAGLFSFLLTGEVLGPRQLAGCALILCGMMAAELLPNGSIRRKPAAT